MSVGESGGASDGSDDYEEEEEELVDQHPRRGAAVAAAAAAYESAATGSSNHRRMPQLQARLAAISSQKMERSKEISGTPGAAAAASANSFLFLNSFSHGSASVSQSTPAANAAGISNNGASTKDGGDALNNYYTSLLTGGSCIRGHHQNEILQTAEQSLKQILSDPFSGELMDDAVIFPCGHTFGSGGIQKIQETSLCQICQVPTRIADGSINLALRAAVLAFRHDRGFPKSGVVPKGTAAKRRRDPDGDQSVDAGRPKGVQFPYVVSDKVLIKGNKRTPERFVGKQAIITTQCLNGWYLVKTLDNNESVRLQYRSLQKIEDDTNNWHQDPVAGDFHSVEISAQTLEIS
ncbi:uncharacterized protein LOC9655197 [Selaginella moellendorffii]|uniref:uncharacterized protein LOC9655197 n=1 Tax=Selaginella moellendorffii TaxID=88036 RepID=UPI000D1C6968|nr:uncharacterized protein LOC9655197 [Selaginella moellendorffii]|eukprot:XP_024524400.1 uncharacterized protein LOC9655197 [Selaginella moellendorffii]